MKIMVELESYDNELLKFESIYKYYATYTNDKIKLVGRCQFNSFLDTYMKISELKKELSSIKITEL